MNVVNSGPRDAYGQTEASIASIVCSLVCGGGCGIGCGSGCLADGPFPIADAAVGAAAGGLAAGAGASIIAPQQ